MNICAKKLVSRCALGFVLVVALVLLGNPHYVWSIDSRNLILEKTTYFFGFKLKSEEDLFLNRGFRDLIGESGVKDDSGEMIPFARRDLIELFWHNSYLMDADRVVYDLKGLLGKGRNMFDADSEYEIEFQTLYRELRSKESSPIAKMGSVLSD